MRKIAWQITRAAAKVALKALIHIIKESTK